MATVTTKLSNGNTRITSIEEALDASNLNFIAETSEIMSPTHGVFAPDHRMIIRADSNDVLGVVGQKYTPIQNSLAMSFMDTIVKREGFHYSSAVSKDNGAVSIITAQSERSEAIRVGDEVAREIKLVNGFNGKVGFGVEFSMLRLVCTNGMVSGERESVIRFKHTIHVHNRMETALRVFDESVSFHEEFIRMSKLLAQKAADKTMVEKFLNGLYSDAKQNEKKKEIITDLFQRGQGNKGETLWDLYNGATEYVDHFHGVDENRTEFSTFGAGDKLKKKAWNLAMELV